MEIKTISGEVKDLTENSLKVNNYWIKFFDTNLIKDIKKNDLVKIQYSDNTKGNRTYHNAKSIEKISEVKEDKLTLDKTTINTILMSAKEIYLSPINKLEYKEIVTKLMEGLKIILKE